jgi:hypothetical protein
MRTPFFVGKAEQLRKASDRPLLLLVAVRD